MRSERESAAEHCAPKHLEREVRLDAVQSPEAVIRERISGGFYHTPAVADVVARRILARGDL
jgi:hypothetical protein